MKKVFAVLFVFLATSINATQLVTRVSEGADNKAIGEAWAMVNGFLSSDTNKCELVIQDKFYATYKSLKPLGPKEVMDKILIACKEELKRTNDEKNKCIILTFEYHSYYFAITDLSLSDLHYSQQWREIGPNMCMQARHMLVFDKQMKFIAHYSG